MSNRKEPQSNATQVIIKRKERIRGSIMSPQIMKYTRQICSQNRYKLCPSFQNQPKEIEKMVDMLNNISQNQK